MAEPGFLAWCQQHQIQTSRVQPGYVAEGWRGIIATEPIDPNTVIMQVPAKLLMSVISARKEPQLASGLPRHQLKSHQILSIHLLHETAKGSASFWHPYLLQLPRQFTTLMTWPPAAVQALQVQCAQEAAAAAQQKARSEWAAARPALQELGLPKKYLSWHAWSWAASCVLSRTMYHPDDPSCGCLTPLADLHNYQPPPPPHEVELRHAAEQLLQQQQQQVQQQQLQHQQQQVQCTAGQDSIQQDLQLKLQPVGAADCQQQHQQQPEEGSANGLLHRLEFNANAQVQLAPLGPVQVPELAGTSQLLQPEHQTFKQAPQIQQQQHLCEHPEQLPDQLTGLAIHPSPGCTARRTQQCCSATITTIDQLQQLQQAALDAGTSVNSVQGVHKATSAESSNAALAADAVGASVVADIPDRSTVSTICDNNSQDAAPRSDSSLCGDGHYDADEQVYKIIARRRYHPGDQVYLCYGRHTNLDLLELYGFLLESNPHDTALLSVDTIQQNMQLLLQQRKQQQEGEGRQWKRQPRQQQGPECEVDVCAADCWVSATGTPSWELTRALRLAAATPAELKHTSYLAHGGSPMSVSSEKLMLRCLLNACRQTLEGLCTVVAEDEAVLANLTAVNAAHLETAAKDRGSGQGAEASLAATAAADLPKQSALQDDSECLQLAVRWRLCYEVALVKCIQQCEQALALLNVHGLLPSGNNDLAYGCREPGSSRESGGPALRDGPDSAIVMRRASVMRAAGLSVEQTKKPVDTSNNAH